MKPLKFVMESEDSNPVDSQRLKNFYNDFREKITPEKPVSNSKIPLLYKPSGQVEANYSWESFSVGSSVIIIEFLQHTRRYPFNPNDSKLINRNLLKYLELTVHNPTSEIQSNIEDILNNHS